ncbi:hypothetical protein GDO86_013394 [Hymenochirus boettgeri]|uniref:MARVEL domain-containing protein n=1 Tax=Hymenochirus boettgeri TaxID=247094 RepID=A0A8T2IYB4_9PIPI|nr:hypothetical protein GDO86_013394 [Hymenochirus boettgeri]
MPTPSSLSVNRDYLKSLPGVVRILQLISGAGFWITIASNQYGGSIHFALFVVVFFWLLTLVIYFLTLLDKQELVPIIGGESWVLANVIYDAMATALHLAAVGIMIDKTNSYSYCNVATYTLYCLYNAYMAATIFACLCSLFYLISAIYFSYKKCKGSQTVI